MKKSMVKVGNIMHHYIQRNGMVGPVLLSDIFPDSEIDARSYFFEMLSAYKKELAMCGIEVDSRRRYIHNTKVQ